MDANAFLSKQTSGNLDDSFLGFNRQRRWRLPRRLRAAGTLLREKNSLRLSAATMGITKTSRWRRF